MASFVFHISHRLIGLLLALATVFAMAQAERLKFEHISSSRAQKLPMAYTIFQDKFGFMLFGTVNGVYKHDGYTFTRSYEFTDDPPIPGGVTAYILEDSQGRLWTSGDHGSINLYNPQAETFTRYWLKTADGKGVFTSGPFSIAEDQPGTFWVGTFANGLFRIKVDDTGQNPPEFTQYFDNPDDSSSLGNNRVFSMVKDRSGRLWVGTWGKGLALYQKESDTFTHYPPNSHLLIYYVMEDQQGMIWIATTRNGIYVFNPDTKEMVANYRHDPNDPASLGSDEIF